MGTEQHRRTLNSVQVLRGIAALFVAIGHIIGEMPRLRAYAGGFDENIVQFRFGVDLFFVISGFIMVYTTCHRPRGALEGSRFLLARFLRLSPLYWAATALTVVIGLVLPSALNHEALGADRILSSLFYLPHRNDNGDYFPIVGPGWTLNYEMFFYVIFALTFLLPWKRGLFTLVGILSLTVLLGRIVPNAGPMLAYYSHPILLEFGFGALLGYAYVQGALDRLTRWILPTALIAILWVAALHVANFADMQQRAFYYGVPATLLVFAAIVADRNDRSVGGWVTLALGDASYSIYLTHLFVARAASIVTARLLPGCPLWLFFIVTLLAVVIVGHLVARWVEIPMHRFTSRLTRPRPKTKTVGAE